MDNSADKEFPFSKYVLIFAAITLIMLYLLLVTITTGEPIVKEYWFWVFVLIIFHYLAIPLLRMTFFIAMGIPAIVLSKEGIKSASKGYLIAWDDITAIQLEAGSGRTSTTKLVLSVKDSWKYIGAIKNPIIRYYRWLAKGIIYYPFNINIDWVKGDNGLIYKEIERYYVNKR